MNLTEILAGVRGRLADSKVPYLWSDPELLEYLNQSINEVTEQKKLFVESTVPPIVQIPILAADVTADYLLDLRVLEVLRAKIRSQTLYMWRTDKMTLDYAIPDWRHLSAGTPRWFLTDFEEGYISIAPKSNQDDIIDMTVQRMPLIQMSLDLPDASPEIHWQHHPRLYNGIMSQAYLKDDTQCLDPKKAATHLALWQVDKVEISKSRQRLQDSYHFMQIPYGAI